MLGLVLALGVVLVAACSAAPSGNAPTPATPADRRQISDGGGVTVTAEWPGPAIGAIVELKLDTHSVDLDSLDLADAVLRNDLGQKLAARPWRAARGGHHRAGELAFEGDAAAFLAGASWVELVLRGVGDVPERVLRWELLP